MHWDDCCATPDDMKNKNMRISSDTWVTTVRFIEDLRAVGLSDDEIKKLCNDELKKAEHRDARGYRDALLKQQEDLRFASRANDD